MRRRGQNRVEVACPHCLRSQGESASAVSTFCRHCGQHFDIAKGKAVKPAASRDRRILTRLAYHARPAGETALPAGDAEPSSSGGWLARASRTLARGGLTDASSANSKLQTRTITCFDCAESQEVSSNATSTICPSCSAYISLRNVEIKNETRQKIRTCGDVIIHKKAAHHGSSLECRNLKVLGALSGNVECSGDAVFQSECRILGVFTCNRLIIRRRAQVAFLQPVYAQELEIYGKVTGDFYCSGVVTIHRGGTVHGDVLAKSLVTNPGGVLDAGLRICSGEAQAREEAREARRALALAEEEAQAPSPDPVELIQDWPPEGARSPA